MKAAAEKEAAEKAEPAKTHLPVMAWGHSYRPQVTGKASSDTYDDLNLF